MRHKLAEAGLEDRITVESAGTHGFHAGEAPDRRAQQAARRRGVSLEGQAARQVVAEDFGRHDLILAMDHGHLSQLQRLAPPQAVDRVHLFMSAVPGRETQDVPDPYFGGAKGFEEVLDLVEAGCEAWITRLRREREW